MYGAAAGTSENKAFNDVAKSENRFGSPTPAHLTLRLSRLEIWTQFGEELVGQNPDGDNLVLAWCWVEANLTEKPKYLVTLVSPRQLQSSITLPTVTIFNIFSPDQQLTNLDDQQLR